jgi:hypothetical protein
MSGGAVLELVNKYEKVDYERGRAFYGLRDIGIGHECPTMHQQGVSWLDRFDFCANPTYQIYLLILSGQV